MLKLFVLLILTTIVIFQALPAFCGVSKTVVFHLSVTIPPHVMTTSNMQSLKNNPFQMVQTDLITRHNHLISMTSVLVP